MSKNIEENTSLEDLIKSSRKISGLDIIEDKISSKIIYKDIKTLIDTIKTYKDVCLELGEKEYTIYDFLSIPEEFRIKVFNTIRLKQIAKLFNQDWIIDWSNFKQYKYFPYFEYKKSTGSGCWVYHRSSYTLGYCYGTVVYYQSEEVSIYIGKQFIDIYIEYLEN